MNMAQIALVAFAVLFSSFAQAGERSVAFKTPEQVANDEVVAKYGNRFSYTDAGSIFGTVADGGYERCKAAVEGGYAKGYKPLDTSGRSKNPIDNVKLFPMIGDTWACAEMNVPGKEHMVVALVPGEKYRVYKRNGVMDENPKYLDRCGNEIFNIKFLSVKVKPSTVLPPESGTFSSGKGGYVPPAAPLYVEERPVAVKRPGFCSRHKVTCWVIGTVIVGGIIYALANRDDDENNAAGPGVSLGPDVSLDTSSTAPTIQAPDTVYNPSPDVSL